MFLYYVKAALFALMVPFVMNPVFADPFFVAPNESLMCTYDALNADEDSTVVFSARWCQECTDLATNTTSCNLTVDETTGICTYTAECKNGYENITEENTANVHCVVHSYNINYNNLYDGINDSSNPSSYTVESPDIELKPATRNGYNFMGWYGNDNAAQTQNSAYLVTQIESGSVGDKDLYAAWNIIPYTISYELNGGSATNPTSYNVETETFTLNNPAKENYDFIGWCETENCSNPALTYTIEQGSTGNKTLYAQWKLNLFNIKYYDGANELSSITPTTYTQSDDNQTITPTEPSKNSRVFVGWCVGSDNCDSPQKTVEIMGGTSGDINLYAQWRRQVTIHFDANAGSDITENIPDDIVCTEGEMCAYSYSYREQTATTPYETDGPARNGYYIIGLNLTSDGSGLRLSPLTTNRPDGYVSISVDFSKGMSSDVFALTDDDEITVYIQWGQLNYTITYELDGGSAKNPTSYNVETPTFTLNNPTKANYEFVGWCETENCVNPALTYTIEQGTTGNKDLYAIWEPVGYTITYYLDGGNATNPNRLVL